MAGQGALAKMAADANCGPVTIALTRLQYRWNNKSKPFKFAGKTFLRC